MTLFYKNLINRLLNLIAIVCIASFAYSALSNIHYIDSMANPDIIQFIFDGRIYKNFSLPENIHASPAFPILLAIVNIFIPKSVEFSELLAARYINIISITVSLFLVYEISKKYTNNLIALATLLLCISHPWTFLMAVGDYSESLFTLAILVSFLFLSTKKYCFYSLPVAGLSFLIRNEGLILFFALFSVFSFYPTTTKATIIDWIKRIKKILLTKSFLIGIGLILGWFLILFINNIYTFNSKNWSELKYGYYFFHEISDRRADIPELRFISTLSEYAVSIARYDKSKINSWETILGISVFLLLSMNYFIIKKRIVKVTSIFIVGYLLLHVGFPAFDHRYFFPILYALYLNIVVSIRNVYLKNDTRYTRLVGNLFVILIIFLTIYSHLSSEQKVEYSKYVQYQNSSHKNAASLIDTNSNLLSNQIDIYSFLPWHISFFMELGTVKNDGENWTSDWITDELGNTQQRFTNGVKTVTFYDLHLLKNSNCLDIACFNTHYKNDESDTLIIRTFLDNELDFADITSMHQPYFSQDEYLKNLQIYYFPKID